MRAGGFQTRLATGQTAELALRGALEGRRFQVLRTGQESWLPAGFSAPLRGAAGDRMARALRHTPDFLAQRRDFPLAYWDAKRNTRTDTAFFALEIAFYHEQLARVAKGERVAIAFMDPDGLLYANWVQRLDALPWRGRARVGGVGSGAPFVLVARASVPLLDEFIGANRERAVRGRPC